MPHEQNQIQNFPPEPDTFHNVTYFTVIHPSDRDWNWSKKTEKQHLYFFNMVEAPKSLWLKAVLSIRSGLLSSELIFYCLLSPTVV